MITLLIAAVCLQEDVKAAPMHIAQVVLKSDTKEIKPVESGEDYFPEVDVSGTRVIAALAGVQTVVRSGKPALVIASPSGKRPAILAHSPSRVFFTWVSADRYKYRGGQHVLSMSIGKPGEPQDLKNLVKVPPQAKESARVLSVIANERSVVTATARMAEGEYGNEIAKSYTVNCYAPGSDTPSWTRTFAFRGDRSPMPGALLASTYPNFANSSIRPLSFMGESLIVCGGSGEPIRCLKMATGEDDWAIDRIWEYERGFVGPSVWQHTIDRFGNREFGPEKRTDTAKRKAFDDQYTCSIIGGPAVLPVKPKDNFFNQATAYVYVAVLRAPKSHYAGYIGECVLYEIIAGQGPNAVSPLPRNVLGSRFAVNGEGIVWAGQNDSLMRIVPSEANTSFGMGPGAPDRVCRLDWYREYIPTEPSTAWLGSDQAGQASAIGQQYCIRSAGGGYVLQEDKSTYLFPVGIVDLKTGEQRILTMKVPMKKPIPYPTSNYSGFGKYRKAIGPYITGVTLIENVGDRVRFVLGWEGKAGYVEFKLEELQSLVK